MDLANTNPSNLAIKIMSRLLVSVSKSNHVNCWKEMILLPRTIPTTSMLKISQPMLKSVTIAKLNQFVTSRKFYFVVISELGVIWSSSRRFSFFNEDHSINHLSQTLPAMMTTKPWKHEPKSNKRQKMLKLAVFNISSWHTTHRVRKTKTNPTRTKCTWILPWIRLDRLLTSERRKYSIKISIISFNWFNCEWNL